MRFLLGLLMSLNAALFFLGAVQHSGVAMGSFHEPVIVPAAIVEGVLRPIAGLGAAAVFARARIRFRLGLLILWLDAIGESAALHALVLSPQPVLRKTTPLFRRVRTSAGSQVALVGIFVGQLTQ